MTSISPNGSSSSDGIGSSSGSGSGSSSNESGSSDVEASTNNVLSGEDSHTGVNNDRSFECSRNKQHAVSSLSTFRPFQNSSFAIQKMKVCDDCYDSLRNNLEDIITTTFNYTSVEDNECNDKCTSADQCKAPIYHNKDNASNCRKGGGKLFKLNTRNSKHIRVCVTCFRRLLNDECSAKTTCGGCQKEFRYDQYAKHKCKSSTVNNNSDSGTDQINGSNNNNSKRCRNDDDKGKRKKTKHGNTFELTGDEGFFGCEYYRIQFGESKKLVVTFRKKTTSFHSKGVSQN